MYKIQNPYRHGENLSHAALSPKMNASASGGMVRWGLTMDVEIQGINLPFRLKIVTDDEEKMLEALSDFQSMILQKVEELE